MFFLWSFTIFNEEHMPFCHKFINFASPEPPQKNFGKEGI